MDSIYAGQEKRQFLRYDYDQPIRFSNVNTKTQESRFSQIMEAMTRNVSRSGILFITNVGKTPTISSLLMMELDYRAANICKEIEDRALTVDNKFIGRVVRIDDNEDGTCGVGVVFVKKTDPITTEIENLFKK